MRRRALVLALVLGVAADLSAGQLLMSPAVPGVTTHQVDTVVDQSEAGADPAFLGTLRGYVEQGLAEQALLGTDGVPADRRVVLVVTGYEMRTPWERILLGAIAGRDSVTTEVRVIHASSGRTLGETVVRTTRRMAINTDDTIARRHAETVVRYLVDGR
jgi:hypothetical protein